MNINAFKVIQTASMINQMTSSELQLLAECIIDNNGEKLANYISVVAQDRDYMNIEVQEPVC
jgi:hypothetical protein